MSVKQQARRQSQDSLETSRPMQSVIVSGVPLDETETKLCRDLSKTYTGVERVTRLYNNNDNPIKSIQVDFTTPKATKTILDQKFILIGGKRYYARGHWSVICHECQKEGHKAADCPQKRKAETRMMGLFREQQAEIETLITEFEAKWNTRLAKLTAPSAHVDVDKLLPALNDLAVVFRQFNEQNAKMIKALNPAVSRLQRMHEELDGGEEFPTLPLPALSRLSLQNGH